MSSDRLLVGVFSANAYADRRRRCRESWFGELALVPTVDAFFVLAGHSGEDPWRRDGDELRLNCPGDYQSLPLRMSLFLRYIASHCAGTPVFKCDDDTYICPKRLIGFDHAAADYIGYDFGPHVDRPAYAHGGAGHFLSRRAVHVLAENFQPCPGTDDLQVGVCLSRHGINLIHDSRFGPFWDPQGVPAPSNDMITSHYVNSDERLEFIRGQWEQ